MFRRILGTTGLGVLIMASPALALPPTGMGLPPMVALQDDAAAILINPAGLAAQPGATAIVSHEGWNGATRLLLSGGSLGLGYGQITDHGIPGNDLMVSLASPFADHWWWGTTWHVPMEGRDSRYDLGLLARPFNFLSVGLTIQDALGNAATGRSYQLGAGFRPFGTRTTLTLDVPFVDGTPLDWNRVQPFFGLTAEIVDGTELSGQVAPDGTFRIGIGTHGLHYGAGAMSGTQGSSAFVRFVAERQSSWLSFHGVEAATLDLGEAVGAANRSVSLLGPLRAIPPHYPILRAVEDARRDPRIGALILKISPLRLGWADLEEVRAALQDFRASGKPLWAYLDEADFRGYYLASAADRVFVHPMGAVDLVGMGQTNLYFKGLMDRLGIQAQFVAIGRYKSAMEPFERTGPGQGEQEQTEALLDDQFTRVVDAIAGSRHLKPDQVRKLVDQGTFTPVQAQAAGLIDEIAQRDEVPKRLEQVAHRDFASVDALDLRYRRRAWAPPRVAIVLAAGSIGEGESGQDGLQGPILGSSTLVRTLRELREDGDVRAVVVRIDSPGGSALASEVMRRELARLAERKPVVISFGDVAASGGFWLGMVPNAPVFADPGTITGSIGVIVGKFNIAGLLEKLGVQATTFKRGQHADQESMLRPFTPEEEAQLQASAEFYYSRFVNLVATRRQLSEGRVRELGSGHVYTGQMAHDLKLVDELGGLRQAIQEARLRAKLGDEPFELSFYPSMSPFGDLLAGDDGRLSLSLVSPWQRSLERLAPWARPGVWLLPPGGNP